MTDYFDPPCPAFAAHLHPGSEIVAINSKFVSDMSRDELAKQLSPTGAKPISLTLQRNGKRQTLRITPILYRDALGSMGRKLTKFGPAPMNCTD
jgi:C-terminal processing protease CtpA/Prc